jgi:carboxymethylenebutenolidase
VLIWYANCRSFLRMDIARPEIKQKRKRWRIAWVGTAVIVTASAFLVWRLGLRHHREYVTITHDGRALQTLVDLPTKVQKGSPVLVLVHEVYGLSDWAKGMADEVADRGFIVVAPDLLSGHGPKGGGYGDFASENDITKAVSELDPAGVTADLDAVVDFARKLPAFSGKIAVVGFSWGGWRSFAFATHRNDLNGVFVFYGTGPTDVSTIAAPVYGFYGGADGGVDVTISATTDAMKTAGKIYEPVTYEGADHGFMRLGEEGGNSNPANKTARDQAFDRLVKLLQAMGAAKGSPG